MTEPIVRQLKGNLILTEEDIPYPVTTVHNAGMAKRAGRYIMLFRAHRRNGRSTIGLAESGDGFHFRVRPEPLMVPAMEGEFARYEEYGIEDRRICAMEGWRSQKGMTRSGSTVQPTRSCASVRPRSATW